jgi:Rieske 2Fe-2S family protein
LLPTPPGTAYTDPAVFAREQARVFEAVWVCAARAGDLPRPGAFRTVPVGRESVLLTRDRADRVRAFLNVCRHRGARLCTEEAGEVRRAFRCPYHAWTYGLDGRLVAAPNLGELPAAERDQRGLAAVHVREWLGYVWVCLADDPPSFDETVRGAVADALGSADAVAAYGVDRLEPGRREVYDVRANWKLIVENFMECYHCATIHPELTGVLPEFAEGRAAQADGGRGAAFGADVDGFTVDGGSGFGRLGGVGEDRDRRYYAVTLPPQVFLNLVPDHVIVHRLLPLAPDRTRVECDWLYDPEVLASGADVARSAELFDRVNRQDFAACERCQPAMASRVYRDGGVLVPLEHHIAGFHRWLADRMADAPAGG